jgi:hypothetical protein
MQDWEISAMVVMLAGIMESGYPGLVYGPRLDTMKSSKTIRTAQGLFILNTTIWLVFGIVSLSSNSLGEAVPEFVRWIIASLMFGNAAAMLVSGYAIGQRIRWTFTLALTVLAINILLTFTDQVGLFDWITLAIDLVLLGLLIAARKWFVTV